MRPLEDRAGTRTARGPEPQHEALERPDAPEVSVVMPCLNEAETVGACVETARNALADHGIHGEVVVADNGSGDGSQAVAEAAGARVVSESRPGYGSALMCGIAAARGRFVIMGDADRSYDFGELPKFVAKLREGYDLVQGCRLERGGGRVEPGAMPLLHRRIGNPIFSALARWWFRAPVNDVYCGMRGFTPALYRRLDQHCTGMEFATEMIVKASLAGARISEVPITLHRDGRTAHAPHLRTLRDGWRTLRFLLLYSPRWLFLVPGILLMLVGAVGYGLALPAVQLMGATFDAHTLLFATLAIVCGYQSLLFAVLTKIYATSEGLLPPDPRLDRVAKVVTLERALLTAIVAIVAGTVLLAVAVARWYGKDFGHLDYAGTMRLVVPGVLLFALGFQTVLSSFFLSLLGMRRR